METQLTAKQKKFFFVLAILIMLGSVLFLKYKMNKITDNKNEEPTTQQTATTQVTTEEENEEFLNGPYFGFTIDSEAKVSLSNNSVQKEEIINVNKDSDCFEKYDNWCYWYTDSKELLNDTTIKITPIQNQSLYMFEYEDIIISIECEELQELSINHNNGIELNKVNGNVKISYVLLSDEMFDKYKNDYMTLNIECVNSNIKINNINNILTLQSSNNIKSTLSYTNLYTFDKKNIEKQGNFIEYELKGEEE